MRLAKNRRKSGLPGGFRGSQAKAEDNDPLRGKRAENFQGLEINYGKPLMVYHMRLSELEPLGVMRPLGP